MAVHFLAFVSFREFPLNVSQVLLSPSLIARNRPAYYLLRYIPFLFRGACPPSSLVFRFLFRVAQFSPYTPSTYQSRLRGLPLWLAPFRAWILRKAWRFRMLGKRVRSEEHTSELQSR